MDYDLTKALERIGNDVSKIQTVCQLSINSIDGKVNSDVQTAMYIIADYADSIKNLTGQYI